jgi:hypothetical protein
LPQALHPRIPVYLYSHHSRLVFIRVKHLAVDFAGDDAVILSDELEDRVKLLMDERTFVGDDSQPDDCDAVVILGGDLGDRGVKPAPQRSMTLLTIRRLSLSE